MSARICWLAQNIATCVTLCLKVWKIKWTTFGKILTNEWPDFYPGCLNILTARPTLYISLCRNQTPRAFTLLFATLIANYVAVPKAGRYYMFYPIRPICQQQKPSCCCTRLLDLVILIIVLLYGIFVDLEITENGKGSTQGFMFCFKV